MAAKNKNETVTGSLAEGQRLSNTHREQFQDEILAQPKVSCKLFSIVLPVGCRADPACREYRYFCSNHLSWKTICSRGLRGGPSFCSDSG